MKLAEILARIDQANAERRLSDAALSKAASGSPDLLRNWRRRIDAGDTEAGANARMIAAVARVLSVSEAWLMTGSETGQRAATGTEGFGEAAVPFEIAPPAATSDGPQPLLSALYGSAATTPAAFRTTQSLPVFDIVAGDALIVDLARLPHPGEVAIVSIYDEAGEARTVVRRYLPPFLVPGTNAEQLHFTRVDAAGVQVRHPVIGIIRGLP